MSECDFPGGVHFGDLPPVSRSTESCSPLLGSSHSSAYHPFPDVQIVPMVVNFDGSQEFHSLPQEVQQNPRLAASMDRALQSIHDVEVKICGHMRSSNSVKQDDDSLHHRILQLEEKARKDDAAVDRFEAELTIELDEARMKLANAEQACESLGSEIELTWKSQNRALQDELRASFDKLVDEETHRHHVTDAHAKELARVKSELGMQVIDAKNKLATIAGDCRKLTEEVEILRKAETCSNDMATIAKQDLQRVMAEKNDLLKLKLQAERYVMELESENTVADIQNGKFIQIELLLDEQKKNERLQEELENLRAQIQSKSSPRTGRSRSKSIVSKLQKKDMAHLATVQKLQQSLEEEKSRAQVLQSEHEALKSKHDSRLQQNRFELQESHNRGLENASLQKDMYSAELELKQKSFEMQVVDLKQQLKTYIALTEELKQTISRMRSTEESLRADLSVVTRDRESKKNKGFLKDTLLREACAQRDQLLAEKKVLEEHQGALKIASHSRMVDDLDKSEMELKLIRKERDALVKDLEVRDQLVKELKMSVKAQAAVNSQVKEITAERDQLAQDLRATKSTMQANVEVQLRDAQKKNDQLSAELKKVMKRESLAALSLGSEVLREKLKDISAEKDLLAKQNENMREKLQNAQADLANVQQQRDSLAADMRKRNERIAELTKLWNEATSAKDLEPSSKRVGRRTEPIAATQSLRMRLLGHEADILEAVDLAAKDSSPQQGKSSLSRSLNGMSPRSSHPQPKIVDLTEDDVVVKKLDFVNVTSPNSTIVFADLTEDGGADSPGGTSFFADTLSSQGVPMESHASDRKHTFNDLLQSLSTSSGFDIPGDDVDADNKNGIRSRTTSAASMAGIRSRTASGASLVRRVAKE